MELIADILMIAGTLAVSFYCIVLSRRLSKFTDLEKGVGGAIAVLSVQVDDMTKTLTKAQKSAVGSANKLEDLTKRAEATSHKLELLIASLHDLPDPARLDPETKDPAETFETPEPANLGEHATDDSQEPLFLSQRARSEAAQ